MNYPPVLFHPINSITAYKGQVIYDTPQTEAKAQTPVPYLQWNARTGSHPAEGPAGWDAQRPDPAAAGRSGPDFAGHAAGGAGFDAAERFRPAARTRPCARSSGGCTAAR